MGSTGPAPAPPGHRRRRLWEVRRGFACSILGTCLSLDETTRVLRKTACLPPRGSEYEIHGAAVGLAARDGPVARLLHKALDRAHAVTLRRYARFRTEHELDEAWKEDVERGTVSGAYWALVTHPLASDALIERAFGVVHMLSHQVGGMNRTRLRRFDSVSARVTELERKLAGVKAEREEERRVAQARIAELEARTDAAEAEVAELKTRAAPDARAPGSRTLARAERQLAYALDTVESLRTELDGLRKEPAQASAKKPADLEPSSLGGGSECEAEWTPACPGCDRCRLEGSVVLYVGGDRGMLTHLRRLAEREKLELLHHDGGKEDGLGSLGRLLARADAVLCPVDRVSHAAVSEVKRACSSSKKTFIPLRRSSVGAFERGLERLAAARSLEPAPASPPI